MTKKTEKGQYGYRTDRKRKQIRNISIFAVMIVILLISRNFIQREDITNLVTISAILLVLPMANLASPLIASWKIGEVDPNFHKEVEVYEEKFPVLYDLIITSNDLIMPIDAAVIHPDGVYMYCPDKSIDVKKGEKFLNEMLIAWKLDGNTKIMTEKSNYMNRLSTLKDVTEEDDDGSAPHVRKLLISLSM